MADYQDIAFNWHSLPTFATMLLYCMLALYVLTRSPRSPVSLAAVAAQFATAAYLLGQGMQANAMSLEQWLPWARNLQWGATVAPAFWYWLTILLLREQKQESMLGYLRRLGYPLGLVFAAGSAVLATSIYIDDWLYGWSAATYVEPEQLVYSRFHAPVGPLYAGMVVLLAGTTAGAAVNVWLGWRLPVDDERRRRFVWLFLSAILFLVGANSLSLANLFAWEQMPTWFGHLLLAAAMLVMAWNVAAYSLLVQGLVIRTDFFYFLTALTFMCLVYGGLFAFAGLQYSFELLGLLAITLIMVIVSHALFDVGRRVLDRLFFGRDVQRLRANLTSVVQTAALTQDLDSLLNEAQVEIAEVSADHLIRLTEEAVRRLNNPAALAKCGLIARIPHTLDAVRFRRGEARSVEATPLEQAQALREAIALAIERLKPPDQEHTRGAPAALQYNILREEYVLDLPNKQIMTRYGISEATFHRNRREAILILAHELGKQEDLLPAGQAERF